MSEHHNGPSKQASNRSHEQGSKKVMAEASEQVSAHMRKQAMGLLQLPAMPHICMQY